MKIVTLGSMTGLEPVKILVSFGSYILSRATRSRLPTPPHASLLVGLPRTYLVFYSRLVLLQVQAIMDSPADGNFSMVEGCSKSYFGGRIGLDNLCPGSCIPNIMK